MRFCPLASLLLCLALLPFGALAHPVINEVMWPGSDLSTSDEWLEFGLPESSAATDLSGWTVSSLKSTGLESVMWTFPAGSRIEPGQYIIVSHFNEGGSRLSSEPAFVNAAVSLLNTGLKLSLKDQNGLVIDEVDDGSGAPFAGSNPTSPGIKASMERIDMAVPGTEKSNWRTADAALGLDSDAKVFATPGFENGSLDTPVAPPPASSSSSACFSDLESGISLQSGAFSGVGKLTLNVQAVALKGTLAGAVCRFDFGDGFVSDSCNPGVHSYDDPGSFRLALEVQNQCGNTLKQEQNIQIEPLPGSSSSLSSVSAPPQVSGEQAKVIISGVLPNPDSADKDKEWIELKNLEDRTVSLAGWHLATGIKKVRRYALETVSLLVPHESLRLYQIETGIELSKSESRVQLLDPSGNVISSVHWSKTEAGRVYQSDSFKDTGLHSTVSRIIDPVTLQVRLDGPSTLLTGLDEVFVRLTGVTPFHAMNDPAFSLSEIQHQEFYRALIENKKVELLFDTDVWTDDGLLRAYVRLEDGRIVQKDLLLSGFLQAEKKVLYGSRQEYLDSEKQAASRRAGYWSLMKIPDASYGGSALMEDKKSMPVSVASSSGRILITEVFPSPASSKTSSGSLTPESGEWIELYNPGDAIINLRGWMLQIGKKTITFGPQSVVEPKRHMILFAHHVGLKLRNAGNTLSLFSPGKFSVVTVDYPSVKNGQSYTYDESTESWCMSKTATPGEAGTCQKDPDSAAAGTKSSVAKKKKSTPRKSVYTTYAASYNQNIDSKGDPIILGSRSASALPSGLFVALGIVLGALVSILILSVGRVRGIIFG